MKRLISFIKNESGQTMVEYGILIVLISVIAIVAIVIVGEKTNNAFSSVANAWTS